MKNRREIIRILGVATCWIGASLMAFGKPIVGGNYIDIATFVGTTGIGIITTANITCC